MVSCLPIWLDHRYEDPTFEEGAVARDSFYHIFQTHGRGRDADAFYGLMANLENDFYINFDAKTQRYEFSCKLLRDWWLRHYGMEV